MNQNKISAKLLAMINLSNAPDGSSEKEHARSVRRLDKKIVTVKITIDKEPNPGPGSLTEAIRVHWPKSKIHSFKGEIVVDMPLSGVTHFSDDPAVEMIDLDDKAETPAGTLMEADGNGVLRVVK